MIPNEQLPLEIIEDAQNGVDYPFQFWCDWPEHVQVKYKHPQTGDWVVPEYGVDYTVTLNSGGEGGIIHFAGNLPDGGVDVFVHRELDITQPLSFVTNAVFPADNLEWILDWLTRIYSDLVAKAKILELPLT